MFVSDHHNKFAKNVFLGYGPIIGLALAGLFCIGNINYSFSYLNSKDLIENEQTSVPFILPLGADSLNSPFTDATNAQISAGPSPCIKNNVSDSFGSSTYRLGEGQKSPNGKWQNVYSGYGSTGVKEVSGTNVFYLSPAIPDSPEETHAALVKSAGSFCDYVLNLDVKTAKQLRVNTPPNAWETAWILFRYTDTFHYYWFLVKPNGIELGKKDCDTCSDPVGGQRFLVTKETPKLNLNQWAHWKIDVVGNHIMISVNGIKVIDYTDNTMSPKLGSGAIAMYSEDAYAQYDNVKVVSK